MTTQVAMPTSGRRWQALGLLAAAYLGGVGLLAAAATALRGDLPTGAAGSDTVVEVGTVVEVDVVAGLAACVAAWLVLTWLAVATAAQVVALTARCAPRPGGGLAGRPPVPRLARRWAGLLLGVGLVAPLGSSTGITHLPAVVAVSTADAVATADLPAPDLPAPDLPALDRPALDLTAWTPDRPAAPLLARDRSVHLVTTPVRVEDSASEDVVVRRGDSLWAIARRHLGPDASAAEVAAEWPRWWSANRDVIGEDPDLLLPGQLLRPPTTA